MKYFPYDYFSSRLYCRFFQYAVYKRQDAGNYGFGYLYIDPGKQKIPDWMFNRYDEVYRLNRSVNLQNIRKTLSVSSYSRREIKKSI